MIENNHDLNPFSCKHVLLRQILVDLKKFRIPESDNIDDPLVICSSPVEEAVEILVFPIIIKNTAHTIQCTQGIIHRQG